MFFFFFSTTGEETWPTKEVIWIFAFIYQDLELCMKWYVQNEWKGWQGDFSCESMQKAKVILQKKTTWKGYSWNRFLSVFLRLLALDSECLCPHASANMCIKLLLNHPSCLPHALRNSGLSAQPPGNWQRQRWGTGEELQRVTMVSADPTW